MLVKDNEGDVGLIVAAWKGKMSWDLGDQFIRKSLF
jgi:hypothetical protein